MIRLVRLNGSPGHAAGHVYSHVLHVYFMCISPSVSAPSPPGWALWGLEGENVTEFLIFWWTPVCQHMTMLGPGSELYGVEWHSGVAQQWRPAPGRPGLALGAFGGPPWARL